jgi:hypothetical protein
LTVLVLAALGLAGCAGAGPAGSPRPAVSAAASGSPFALASGPTVARRLGLIAFTTGGRLELIDLAACRVTVVRRSDAVQPRFSADGRWPACTLLADGNPSRPVVIPAVGGAAHSPLRGGIVA